MAASDCAIFIGGRMGTMNEFTLAFDFGKCIGLMEGTGGIVDRTIRTLLDGMDKDNGSRILFSRDTQTLLNFFEEAHTS